MPLFRGLLILVSVLVGCSPMTRPVEPRPASTFAKFLKLAEDGNAKSQNLVGFMLYFGEGIQKNRYTAHRWFHRAADQGYVSAQLNLAVMHYLGAGVPKDMEEAERYFRLARENGSRSLDSSSRLPVPDSLAELAERAVMEAKKNDSPGEATFVTFCAGCHGLNGIAAYVGAPSFALGERMEKSDADLFRTITQGHGVMPTWEGKLSRETLSDALRFVRTLPLQYQNGIAQVLRPRPEIFFFFGPMHADPTGYYQDPDY